MLRVLLCLTCCGAPKLARPARGKANVIEKNVKLVEEADFKDLINTGEEETSQLLTNQIQANNESYGSKSDQTKGRILETSSNAQIKTVVDSISRQAILKESTMAPSTYSEPLSTSRKEEPELDYTGVKELDFDDRSVSPPSSIDIEPFKENPGDRQPPSTSTFAASPPIKSYTETAVKEEAHVRTGSQQEAQSTIVENKSLNRNIPSVSRIGEYARIEYSPVEDLESLTATSHTQSRAGSEKGEQSRGREREQSGKSSPRPFTANGSHSRASSQGIESTSISIASQLSNEQLQQNLTNMLESANSLNQLFGTIGLPLGPVTETAKTSPETTGAALTSASQDSLSDPSLGGPTGQKMRGEAGTVDYVSTGAALVDDSIEDPNYVSTQVQSASRAGKLTMANNLSVERLESVSISTTTSGALTNPTPTPSDMSATSSTKKKRKLRAKSLLKKLKPGSKKKSKEESGDNK